jgi:hypothetical protein
VTNERESLPSFAADGLTGPEDAANPLLSAAVLRDPASLQRDIAFLQSSPIGDVFRCNVNDDDTSLLLRGSSLWAPFSPTSVDVKPRSLLSDSLLALS